jgi:hypothetical protein
MEDKFEGPVGSDWVRSPAAVVLTLTAKKRLLVTATGVGQSSGCMRYCGHRPPPFTCHRAIGRTPIN